MNWKKFSIFFFIFKTIYFHENRLKSGFIKLDTIMGSIFSENTIQPPPSDKERAKSQAANEKI